MRPVLFTLGIFEIRSYAFFLTLAGVVMFVLALRRAPRFGTPRDVVLNAALLTTVSMVSGSKFWSLFFSYLRLSAHGSGTSGPLKIGFASVGGYALVIIVLSLYLTLVRQNLRNFMDAIAPGFLLSAAIGRAGGCFLAGCCFGRPTLSVLGVVFPPEGHLSPYPQGAPQWPTQLFEAGLSLFGFALILLLERRKRTPGFNFLFVTVWYGGERFLVEQFRYYPQSQILARLGPILINYNHVLLLSVIIFSAILWRTGWKSKRAPK